MLAGAGALTLPDIGQLFPDTDPEWAGCDSEKANPRLQGYLAHKKPRHPRTTIGPKAQGYCRVLRGGCFWMRIGEGKSPPTERDFFINNLLVRDHHID